MFDAFAAGRAAVFSVGVSCGFSVLGSAATFAAGPLARAAALGVGATLLLPAGVDFAGAAAFAGLAAEAGLALAAFGAGDTASGFFADDALIDLAGAALAGVAAILESPPDFFTAGADFVVAALAEAGFAAAFPSVAAFAVDAFADLGFAASDGPALASATADFRTFVLGFDAFSAATGSMEAVGDGFAPALRPADVAPALAAIFSDVFFIVAAVALPDLAVGFSSASPIAGLAVGAFFAGFLSPAFAAGAGAALVVFAKTSSSPLVRPCNRFPVVFFPAPAFLLTIYGSRFRQRKRYWPKPSWPPRNSASSALVSRARARLRCGKRPKRATMSRCSSA